MSATNLVGRVRRSSLGLGGAVGLLGRHFDWEVGGKLMCGVLIGFEH